MQYLLTACYCVVAYHVAVGVVVVRSHVGVLRRQRRESRVPLVFLVAVVSRRSLHDGLRGRPFLQQRAAAACALMGQQRHLLEEDLVTLGAVIGFVHHVRLLMRLVQSLVDEGLLAAVACVRGLIGALMTRLSIRMWLAR